MTRTMDDLALDALAIAANNPERGPLSVTGAWARDYALRIVTTMPRNQWIHELAQRTPEQARVIRVELDTLVPDLAALREIADVREMSGSSAHAASYAAQAWRVVRKLFSFTPEGRPAVRGWFGG